MKIAVLSDLHYSQEEPGSERRYDLADILLLRAVRRINRLIRPDLTLLMGDLLNDGLAPDATPLWRRLRRSADQLESPYLALPGNHDVDAGAFYRVFDRPPEHYDLKGLRFITFVDPEEPNWNARRRPEDLRRMMAAREGYAGPLAMLQHTSLLPPGTAECPFNFVNADEVITTMRQARISLSISGHYHQGVDLVRSGEQSFVVAPALCEPPFGFLVVTMDGEQVRVERHSLAMRKELGLYDLHVHTPLAYCSENMDVVTAMRLAQEFGLRGIAFCEHSGQLYFDAPTFWNAAFLQDGIRTRAGVDNRMPQYFKMLRKADGASTLIGLELDVDFRGRPVIRPVHRRRIQIALAGMHWLPELLKPQPDFRQAGQQFLTMAQRLCNSGIDVLAHPFRVLRQADGELVDSLIEPTVEVLRESEVAAELNFHHYASSAKFVRRCLEGGVRLALGSDSHDLCQVGELAPHLALLAECGCSGSLSNVLLDVEALIRRKRTGR